MKPPASKLSLFWLLALICPAVLGQQNPPSPLPALQVTHIHDQITFVSSNTFCHQGYAWDGTNHYSFDNQAIYVWRDDANWTSVSSNLSVFATAPPGLNHLGDGDYYNGQLYLVAENWGGCGNYTNQSLLTFDAATLQLLSVHNVAADDHEVSGLAVVPSDGPNGTIYVTSYCDGSKIWEYDLSTFALIGTLALNQSIPAIQGITWANGLFYISQDYGNIYSLDYSGDVSLVYTSSIPGSHEGLKYVQGQIRWLIDGGLGHKFIYYVALDSVLLSFPASAAGWIVEASSGLGQPWFPVATGFAVTNSAGASVVFPPPLRNTFYHLRQP
jgi:hypothetical protein